jgi:hypothetical protein
MLKSMKRRAKRKIALGSEWTVSRDAELVELKSTDPSAYNDEAEEDFQLIVCELIARRGPLKPGKIIAESAFRLHLSISTTKRYLIKHTTELAHFCYTDDGRHVTCKPHKKRA